MSDPDCRRIVSANGMVLAARYFGVGRNRDVVSLLSLTYLFVRIGQGVFSTESRFRLISIEIFQMEISQTNKSVPALDKLLGFKLG